MKVEIPNSRHGQVPCQLGRSPGAGTGMIRWVLGQWRCWSEDEGALGALERQAGTPANGTEVHSTAVWGGHLGAVSWAPFLRLQTYIPGAGLTRTSFPSRPPRDREHHQLIGRRCNPLTLRRGCHAIQWSSFPTPHFIAGLLAGRLENTLRYPLCVRPWLHWVHCTCGPPTRLCRED